MSCVRSHCLPPRIAWWGSLACGILFSLAGGSLYVVGVWVGQLKVALALTQLEANLIATFLFTGGCFVGPLTAWLFHLTDLQPWSLTLVLGALGCGGYVLFLLVVKSIIRLSHDGMTALLCFASTLIGTNIMTLFGPVLATSSSHLEGRAHQVYISLMQGFFAVGNVIWPLVAWGIDHSKAILDDYLGTLFLTLAITTFSVGVACSLFLAKPRTDHTNNTEAQPLTAAQPPAPQERLDFVPMLRLLCSPEFALVVVLYFVGLGVTANMISNISSILKATVGPLGKVQNPYLTMFYFGLAQLAGRIGCIVWNAFGTAPQPYVPLVASFGLLFVAFLVMFVHQSLATVYTGFALSGVAYGMVWSSSTNVVFRLVDLATAAPHERSQLKPFGITLLYFISPAWGPFFANLVTGIIYDAHGTRPSPDSDKVCYGVECYHWTFGGALIVSVCGALFSLWCALRDKKRQ